MKIEIKNRLTGNVICSGDFNDLRDCVVENRADLRGVDLRGAYLRGADLWGADLRGADLQGADLWGADLWGAKNYFNSIDVCIEIIKRNTKLFTDKEWSVIGKIYVNRWCWDTIKNEYGKKPISIFKKLSKLGFNEYEDYYKKFIAGGGK